MNPDQFPEQNSFFKRGEEILYDKLDAIEKDRDRISADANALYAEVQKGRSDHPNSREVTQLNEKEQQYWAMQEQVNALNEKFRGIEQSLQLMEAGKMSAAELRVLLDSFKELKVESGSVGSPEAGISKRRLAIERDKKFAETKRLTTDDEEAQPENPIWYEKALDAEHAGEQGWTDYREPKSNSSFEDDLHVSHSSNPNHLTTGRHGNKVKNLGSVTPDEASKIFHHYTADTHGGKVGHGKERYKHKNKGGKSFTKGKDIKKK